MRPYERKERVHEQQRCASFGIHTDERSKVPKRQWSRERTELAQKLGVVGMSYHGFEWCSWVQ